MVCAKIWVATNEQLARSRIYFWAAGAVRCTRVSTTARKIRKSMLLKSMSGSGLA